MVFPSTIPEFVYSGRRARQALGGKKETFNPKGFPIFSNVSIVGFPVPLSNSDKIRGDIFATFLAYSACVNPAILRILRVASLISMVPRAKSE
jgi:hypothetical protein